MQGAQINEKAHYETYEQFMCVVEGTLEIILVPHIYHKEVVIGDNSNRNFFEYDVNSYKESLVERPEYKDHIKRTSPIDFLQPQRQYYNFRDIVKYKKELKAGDCIFVPAFYFYQFKAKNMSLK